MHEIDWGLGCVARVKIALEVVVQVPGLVYSDPGWLRHEGSRLSVAYYWSQTFRAISEEQEIMKMHEITDAPTSDAFRWNLKC